MALSLSTLAQQFASSLGLGGAGGSVIGIDIGASSVKVVQLRPSKGVAILETYGEIALGPYGGASIGKAVKLTPEKTAEALAALIKEANVTARTAGLSIPFSSSLVSIIEMPKTDQEQLKRMIPIEARKYIPLPISEVTLDWFVIPDDIAGNSAFDKSPGAPEVRGQEVLLVAIHNDALRSYQTISQTVDISAKFYEIEIFSAARSSLGHGVAPMLVIDMGAATTKMYVVERGIVRLTHLLTYGGQHITEYMARTMNWEFDKAERIKREHGLSESGAFGASENAKIKEALLSTLDRVFSEANRVVLSYGKRYNKNVSRVVLMGGGASLPGLAPHANTMLNTEVEIAHPFGRTEAPAFLDSVLREIGPGFAVAVGVALRELRQS